MGKFAYKFVMKDVGEDRLAVLQSLDANNQLESKKVLAL